MTKNRIAVFWTGAWLTALLLISAMDHLRADTIFIWTDEKGVRHFSNTPPPDPETQFSKIESGSSTPADGEPESRRGAYDQMVQEYQQQASEIERQRKQAEAEQAAREELERQRQLETKNRAERQRLEEQIQQLRRRALSPTFSGGMREAQIKALEEQLQKLDGGSGADSRPAN